MPATVANVTTTQGGRRGKVHVFSLAAWNAAADTATIPHLLGTVPAYVLVTGIDGLANADAEAHSLFQWVLQTKDPTNIVLRKANVAASNVAGVGALVYVFEQAPAQVLEAAALGATLAGRIPPGLAMIAALT